MKTRFTHVGRIDGVKTVKLRETKNFWVTETGMKFRKSTGIQVAEWPHFSLLLDTIKEADK